MSTAIATVPTAGIAKHEDRLTTVQRVGNILAASGYFADVKDMAQAAVKVMAGEELGIAPVAAVMGINIIKGKVCLSANLIAAQVRRHGYNFRHTRFDDTGCVLDFYGKDGALLGDSSFTEDDAKKAGVYGDMYKKFPRNMYFSRAMSNGAKWYCPEVMSGLPVYVPEELGAKVDADGDIIDAEPIDTGGHQMNSRAAQEYVRDNKIAQMKQAAPAPALHEIGDDDIPSNMGGTWVDPQTEPSSEKHVAAARQRAMEPEKPWTTFKGMLQAFADIKAALAQATGSDVIYYGELDLCDVRHANEFKSGEKALKCFASLKAALAQAKQEAA